MPSPRALLAPIALALALAACTSTNQNPPLGYAATGSPQNATVQRMYGAVTDKGWHIPPVDPAKMDPQNIRRLVDDPTGERPGTIVVDTDARFLYLVMEGGKAMRYRVGVGKAGLEFEGKGTIARKASWPRWTPTSDMIRREPEKYGNLQDGMDGGIDNPLGARALYLYKNGRDTLYRIHGTNQAWSIGRAVSSGCIRMLNQDVIDLTSRVPTGTRVVVRQ